MINGSLYTVELYRGDELSVTMHGTAADALVEIRRAKSEGWRIDRIERDDVVIGEAELRRYAEDEGRIRSNLDRSVLL